MSLRRLLAPVARRVRRLVSPHGMPQPPLPSAPAERINLDDPATAADPFGWYKPLRPLGSVHYLRHHASWVVIGRAAARQVLNDPVSFSSEPWAFIDPVMLGAAPAEHARVRPAVSRRFNGEMLRGLDRLTRDLTRAALRPRLEFVSGVARVVSRRVAARLIGFEGDALAALDTAEDAVAAMEPDAFDRLLAVLDDLAPQSELFTVLTMEGGLTPDEARSLCRLLWVASTATSERTIAHCGLLLASDPELQATLRADPAGLAPYLEEVLRLYPAELFLRRVTACEADVEGHRIPAGAQVLISLPGANRDPAAFDEPDSFRVDRGGQHLSFGSGIHTCVGGPLNRKVTLAVLQELLANSSSIELACPREEVPFTAVMVAYAPRELPLRLQGLAAGPVTSS